MIREVRLWGRGIALAAAACVPGACASLIIDDNGSSAAGAGGGGTASSSAASGTATAASSSGSGGAGGGIGAIQPIHVKDLACGGKHTCAIKADKSLWCWGGNDRGQLGDGKTDSESHPVQVQGISAAAAVSTGFAHSCAIALDGSAWCWGANHHNNQDSFDDVYDWHGGDGALGDGTTTDRALPEQVVMIKGVQSISAGRSHTCALKQDGSLWCWGEECPDFVAPEFSEFLVPEQMEEPGSFKDVAAATWFTCTLKTDGSRFCWGIDFNGELGTNSAHSLTCATFPLWSLDTLVTAAEAVYAGGVGGCGIVADGHLWCWWNNRDNGGWFWPPHDIGIGNVRMAALGYDYFCALKTDGALWCWGVNDHGQLRRNWDYAALSTVTL